MVFFNIQWGGSFKLSSEDCACPDTWNETDKKAAIQPINKRWKMVFFISKPSYGVRITRIIFNSRQRM
jgi:hypothetical protein